MAARHHQEPGGVRAMKNEQAQNKTVRVEFQMSPKLLAEVDAATDEQGVSRAEYIRLAVEHELAEATVPEMLARLEDKLDVMREQIKPEPRAGYRMSTGTLPGT